jgi:hypothetical protein
MYLPQISPDSRYFKHNQTPTHTEYRNPTAEPSNISHMKAVPSPPPPPRVRLNQFILGEPRVWRSGSGGGRGGGPLLCFFADNRQAKCVKRRDGPRQQNPGRRVTATHTAGRKWWPGFLSTPSLTWPYSYSGKWKIAAQQGGWGGFWAVSTDVNYLY